MFPNIYSNDSRTKGSVTCYVNNLQYMVRIVRCTYLEVTIDLGKHAWPEYAGRYPQAVGIKVTGLYGFDDVIWVGTGTDGHVTKWIYKGGILSAIIAGAVTLIGVLIANSKSNAVMEYKIEELTREVRKHNGFAEKIPVIQRDIQVLNHRMTDIETHEHERS